MTEWSVVIQSHEFPETFRSSGDHGHGDLESAFQTTVIVRIVMITIERESESDRDAGEDVDVVPVPHQPEVHARVEHHVIGDRIRDPGAQDPSKIDV